MYDFTHPYINKGVLFHIAVIEDDGDVVLAIATRHALAVDALDEHPLHLALHHLKILDLVLQRDLSHYLAAFGFYFLWNLVGHRSGFGASAH